MKWNATAKAVNDEGMCSWEIEADSADEAFIKGVRLAQEAEGVDHGTVEVKPLEEDRQLICMRLTEVLQLTRALWDLEELVYDDKKGAVRAYFANGGGKTANVAGDSGVAMIKDILKQIV